MRRDRSLVKEFLEAKENLSRSKEKEYTQCKQIEQVKKEWVLFVNPSKQTFYVEEVEIETKPG